MEVGPKVISQLTVVAGGYSTDAWKCFLGQFAWPLVFLMVSFTVDAASTNIKNIRGSLQEYAAFNKTNRISVVKLLAVILCLAHQDHICSRAGAVALSARRFGGVGFITGA